jgi:nucleoside-triphosphatase
VKGITGPKIGKYRVNLKVLSNLGVGALNRAAQSSDLIAVDEIGPMELLSPEFRRALHSYVIDPNKPALCIVHKRFQDPLIEELRASGNSVESEITFENRDQLPDELSKDIIQFLKSTPESGGKNQ